LAWWVLDWRASDTVELTSWRLLDRQLIVQRVPEQLDGAYRLDPHGNGASSSVASNASPEVVGVRL
jgi:hypothetical protein